jgi:hypothetical protein
MYITITKEIGMKKIYYGIWACMACISISEASTPFARDNTLTLINKRSEPVWVVVKVNHIPITDQLADLSVLRKKASAGKIIKTTPLKIDGAHLFGLMGRKVVIDLQEATHRREGTFPIIVGIWQYDPGTITVKKQGFDPAPNDHHELSSLVTTFEIE